MGGERGLLGRGPRYPPYEKRVGWGSRLSVASQFHYFGQCPGLKEKPRGAVGYEYPSTPQCAQSRQPVRLKHLLVLPVLSRWHAEENAYYSLLVGASGSCLMSATSRTPAWFLLTRHWLSLVGTGLVTTAVLSWLFVLPMHSRGHHDDPYVGIVVFLILPAMFFIGLWLNRIGIYLSRRAIQQGRPDGECDRKVAIPQLAWFFGITVMAERSS